MENVAYPLAVLTGTCVLSLLAGYVGARLMRASRSNLSRKRLDDLERTMADLESSFRSLMESHKRLRSRTGMRELREERNQEPETKLQVRRRVFGNAAGPAFAQIQARLNANHPDRSA
jgi:hypothetical protein